MNQDYFERVIEAKNKRIEELEAIVEVMRETETKLRLILIEAK